MDKAKLREIIPRLMEIQNELIIAEVPHVFVLQTSEEEDEEYEFAVLAAPDAEEDNPLLALVNDLMPSDEEDEVLEPELLN